MKMLVPSNITFKTMSLVSPPAVAVLLVEHAVQESVRGLARPSPLICYQPALRLRAFVLRFSIWA